MRVSLELLYQIFKLGTIILILCQVQMYWQYWQSTSLVYTALAFAGTSLLSGLGYLSAGVSTSLSVRDILTSELRVDDQRIASPFPDFSATVDMENNIFGQVVEQSVLRETFAVDIIKSIAAAESLTGIINVLEHVDLQACADNLTAFVSSAKTCTEDLHMLSSTTGSSVTRFIDQFFDAVGGMDATWDRDITPVVLVSARNYHAAIEPSLQVLKRLFEEINRQVHQLFTLHLLLVSVKDVTNQIQVGTELKKRNLSNHLLTLVGAKGSERRKLDEIVKIARLVETWTTTTSIGITSTRMWLEKVHAQILVLMDDVSAGLGTEESQAHSQLQKIALDIVKLQRSQSEPPIVYYANEPLLLSAANSMCTPSFLNPA